MSSTPIASKVSLEQLEGLPEVVRLPLYDTLRGLARAINETDQAVAAAAGAPAEWPRVKGVLNDDGDPFPIDPETHLPGTCFDDVGAAAATALLLPTPAQVAAAGFPIETKVYHVRFYNTSGQRQKVIAQGGATIQVDEMDLSAADGHVEVLSSGGMLELALFDDCWRGGCFSGELEIDG